MRTKELRQLATDWRTTILSLSEARAHRHETPVDPTLKAHYQELSTRVRKLKREFDHEQQARVYLSILQYVGFRPVVHHGANSVTVRAF